MSKSGLEMTIMLAIMSLLAGSVLGRAVFKAEAPTAATATSTSTTIPVNIEKIKVMVMDAGVDYKVPKILPFLNQKHVVDNPLHYQELLLPKHQHHGSHVAALTLYGLDNSKLCNRVELYSCRVNPYSVKYCLEQAENLGVKYVNISLAGRVPVYSEAKALKAAVNSGMIITVAAGNSNHRLDVYPEYPAAYALNFLDVEYNFNNTGINIIVVGSLDRSGNKAKSSNYADGIIYERGDEVTSPVNGDTISGTSFASPVHMHKLLQQECNK